MFLWLLHSQNDFCSFRTNQTNPTTGTTPHHRHRCHPSHDGTQWVHDTGWFVQKPRSSAKGNVNRSPLTSNSSIMTKTKQRTTYPIKCRLYISALKAVQICAIPCGFVWKWGLHPRLLQSMIWKLEDVQKLIITMWESLRFGSFKTC